MALQRGVYRPRDAEHAVLHQVIAEHLEAFLRAVAEAGDGAGLPQFVEREFREFLTCGVFEHGMARFQCEGCAREHLVPFSCKGRAWCPSCGGRRMTERAAHLVDAVLPWVPVRQWVLTVPDRLRYQMAWNHGLSRAVLRVYTRVLLDVYTRGARERGVPGGRTGSATVMQRAGSGLNVNLHFHTLVLDGVFIEARGGALAFHPAPGPTDAEVAAALATIRQRVQRLLVRRGLEPGDDAAGPADPLADESPIMAGIVGASVQGRVALGSRAGARVRRLGDVCDTAGVTSRGPRQAHLDGFDLHANVRVSANDRAGVERLARYVLRPPFAPERLRLRGDGRIALELERATGSSGDRCPSLADYVREPAPLAGRPRRARANVAFFLELAHSLHPRDDDGIGPFRVASLDPPPDPPLDRPSAAPPPNEPLDPHARGPTDARSRPRQRTYGGTCASGRIALSRVLPAVCFFRRGWWP